MLSKVLPLRRAQAAVEQQKYDSLPAAEREHYALPLQPLKLIIMSATMRVNDFQNPRLFPTALPPIIKVMYYYLVCVCSLVLYGTVVPCFLNLWWFLNQSTNECRFVWLAT